MNCYAYWSHCLSLNKSNSLPHPFLSSSPKRRQKATLPAVESCGKHRYGHITKKPGASSCFSSAGPHMYMWFSLAPHGLSSQHGLPVGSGLEPWTLLGCEPRPLCHSPVSYRKAQVPDWGLALQDNTLASRGKLIYQMHPLWPDS